MEELNLRELLARESEQVEWKENVADVDDVVATLSAFANDWANLGGGYVVCGAAEGRDEHGFAVVRTPGLTARLREVEGQVMTRCRERVTPPIVPLVHELPAADPSHRVLVFVMPATRHAHVFRRSTDGGKYYIRQSRSTVQARNGLFRELMVRKGDLEPWDHRPNPEARVEDIDLVVLRDTLQCMSVWDQSTSIDEYLRVDRRIFALVPSLCVEEPLTSAGRRDDRVWCQLSLGRARGVLGRLRDPQPRLRARLGAAALDRVRCTDLAGGAGRDRSRAGAGARGDAWRAARVCPRVAGARGVLGSSPRDGRRSASDRHSSVGG